MRQLLFAFALLAFSAPRVAHAQTDLTGWWRASIEHNGEHDDLYLHFDTLADGRHRARFSVPSVRTYEGGLGPYEVSGDSVQFPGISWRLAIKNGGEALEGQIPEALAPLYSLTAHFERAEALAPPREFSPPERPPAAVWRTSVGSPVWAGLLHDDARTLFVASEDGRVRALDDQSGREFWTVNVGSAVRAAPALQRGRVYITADRSLAVLNARTGALIWRAEFGAERGPVLPITDQNSKWDHYGATAVIDRGRVFVGSRDGCLYALHASNGARAWRHCTEDLITGSPALTSSAVLFSSFDGHVYALSRHDGRVLWSRDVHGPSPADLVVANGAVLVGSRSYDLLALDVATGAPRWTHYFWWSWVDSPPNAVDGVIYIGASDMLTVQAIDTNTGRRRWAAPAPGWAWGRVAVGARSVYAGVTGGTPYIAPRAGALAAYDRRTGALRWLFTPEHAEDHTLYGFAAAPVLSGRRVFAADLAGNVYCFDDRG